MNVEELVSALTLEEKAGLCSGADFWHTKAVERLGIPAIKVSDGPHGLRTQKEGSTDPNDAIEAVCFPAGCAAAASFDPALTRAGPFLPPSQKRAGRFRAACARPHGCRRTGGASPGCWRQNA